jgi:tetratricopeptide (TPR) repeat protein
VSEERKPQKKDTRKNRVPARRTIIALVVVVIVLLGVVIWLALRAGVGSAAVQRLGQGIAQLPGLQLLLGQIGSGRVGLNTRGQKLLREGAELEKEGKVEEALERYRKAQKAMPKHVAPYLAQAQALESLDELEKAQELLQKAVEVDPDHARARRELGRMLCLNDEVEACAEALRAAIALDPENAQGHYWLALAYQQGAEERFAEAERAYLRALSLEPDSAKMHLALGGLYQGQPGMEAQAFEQFSEALRLAVQTGEDKLEARARSELARYYYGQNNYDLCIQELQKALEKQPKDEDTLRRLGLCFAMRGGTGDLEQAVAALEESLLLDFGQIDTYYLVLGQLYASQDEHWRALFAWDQLMRLSDNEELKAEVGRWLEEYQQAMREGRAP